MVIKQIKMKTIPHMNGKSCKPFIELHSLSKMSMFYTGKNDNLRTYKDKADKRKGSRMLKNHRTDPYVIINQPPDLSKTPRTESVMEESKFKVSPKLERKYISVGLGSLDDLESKQMNFLVPPKESKQVIFDLEPAENIEDEDDDTVIIPQRVDQLVAGDILLKIKHKGNFSNPLVCRI